MDTNRIPTVAVRPKRTNIGRLRKSCKDQLHLQGQGNDTTPNRSEVMMMMMMMMVVMMIMMKKSQSFLISIHWTE